MDTFIFNTGHGNDLILDFDIDADILRLNADLVGTSSSGQDVLAQFGSVTSAGVVLDFGDGDVITIGNLTSLSGLGDDISIF